MSNSKALVATDPQQFAITLPTKEEILEIFQENMEGVEFRCERVKIPSGGGIVWEIVDEDGNTDTVKELIGVIIDHHPANGYWAEEYSGKNQPPECSSMDGVTGTGIVINGAKHTKCATCPMNQFKSDPKGGNGKACKNMHRAYLLPENTVFPLLITLPPTSLGAVKDYVRRLTNKLRKLTGVVTKITLEKDKNDGGILFSRAVFGRVGDISKEDAQKMADHGKVLKPYLRNIGLTNDDYSTGEDAAGGGGGSSAGSGSGSGGSSVDDLPDYSGPTIDVPGQPYADYPGDDSGGKAW